MRTNTSQRNAFLQFLQAVWNAEIPFEEAGIDTDENARIYEAERAGNISSLSIALSRMGLVGPIQDPSQTSPLFFDRRKPN